MEWSDLTSYRLFDTKAMAAKGAGWLPQPDSEKDKIYEPPSGPNLEKCVDLRMTGLLQKDPYDQGTIRSCTANAIAAVLTYCEGARGRSSQSGLFDPSRLHIYFNERLLNATTHEILSADALKQVVSLGGSVSTVEGKTFSHAQVESHLQKDPGATLRDGLKTVQKYGACCETTWPYLGINGTYREKEYFTPPDDAVEEGLKNVDTALTYWRIRDNGEVGDCTPDLLGHLEAALAEGYPVMFGLWLSSECTPLRHAGTLEQQGLTKDALYLGWVGERDFSVFGHAVVAVGYDRDKQTVLVLNSWGSSFGENGFFYLPYKWFLLGNTFTDTEGMERIITDDFWLIRCSG